MFLYNVLCKLGHHLCAMDRFPICLWSIFFLLLVIHGIYSNMFFWQLCQTLMLYKVTCKSFISSDKLWAFLKRIPIIVPFICFIYVWTSITRKWIYILSYLYDHSYLIYSQLIYIWMCMLSLKSNWLAKTNYTNSLNNSKWPMLIEIMINDWSPDVCYIIEPVYRLISFDKIFCTIHLS